MTFPAGVSPLDPRRNLKTKGKRKKEMNKLMKMATVVAGVGAMLNFAGCGSKGPDQVALDLLKKLQEGKADQAFLEKTCTKETAGVFTMFGGMIKDATKGATWTATQTYIDDDVATVMIKQDGGAKPGEEAYYLKKIDGQWKLHMDKEHPGKDMISKKTATELLQTFKNDVIIAFNEQELNKKATPEFIAGMKEEFGPAARAKMTDKGKKELESIKKATFTVKSASIEKDEHDCGVIEFEPSLDGRRGKMKVKRVNGTWKLNEIR